MILPDDIPFAWDDGVAPPVAPGPYPQGFALTVPVAPGAAPPDRAPGSLARYVEVGAALGRCLSADLTVDEAPWADLTLRVSFRRDGAVNGIPRIVHISGAADEGIAASGRRRILAALDRCAPLPFTPSLGRAIAGQIFAIRFVQQRKS